MHEADLSCRPSVSGRWGTVAQKLMKLFGEVSDGVWPGVGVLWPSFRKACEITDSRSVCDFCGSSL